MKRQTENIIQETQSTTGVEKADGPVQLPAGTGGFDIERLQAENPRLKTSIRLDAAHRQITGELRNAGARSPELLFTTLKADLQFAADGDVENAAALIDRLKRNFPEQFGFERPAAAIDAGAGLAVRPQLSKEALAKMKPAEIAALDWADVKRVLAQ